MPARIAEEKPIRGSGLIRVPAEGMAEAAAVMVEVGSSCSSTDQGLQGSNQAISATEAEKVRCECCRLSEECTPAYIAHIRGLYGGRWICGLCVEAVKEERRRGGWGGGNMEDGWEEALQAHMSVCMQFNSLERVGSPVADIAEVVRRLFRRSSDAGFVSRSAPSSPIRRRPPSKISRANSCFDDFPPPAPI